MTIQTLPDGRKEASIWLGLTVYCEYGDTNMQALNRLFFTLHELAYPRSW